MVEVVIFSEHVTVQQGSLADYASFQLRQQLRQSFQALILVILPCVSMESVKMAVHALNYHPTLLHAHVLMDSLVSTVTFLQQIQQSQLPLQPPQPPLPVLNRPVQSESHSVKITEHAHSIQPLTNFYVIAYLTFPVQHAQ